jgi:uncharacterized membrane protein YeiH
MIEHPFQTAVGFDLAAIFLFAITGALAGVRRGYDLVGATVLALATALAGGLLRDILLQRGTPVLLTDGRYLFAVLLGTATVAVLRGHVHRLRLVILLVDALGLGIYGVVGAQKALAAGLPITTALLLGTINAVGGSMVRDILTGEEPLIFKPGEWYALSALAGCGAFLACILGARLDPHPAAVVGIAVAFSTRVLSIRLGWRTAPLGADGDA